MTHSKTMLYDSMACRYPCAASWTHGGSKITVKDEGICYIIECNGEYIGAIDDDTDLNTFAAVNGYTESGTTYTPYRNASARAEDMEAQA